MKILVLGFSVTAEKQGYVETAIARLPAGTDLQIVKAGFGGMQPYHARYLFPGIIAEHAPDAIVLDHATPAFRNFSVSHDPYRNAFLSILRACTERGIRLAVLDLPRNDVDYADDWVSRENAELCAALNLPYHRVPLTEGLLRDEVHPTAQGLETYADALLSLIPQAAPVAVAPGLVSALPRYDAITVTQMAGPAFARQVIDRGNFVVTLVELAAGADIRLEFADPVRVCGLTARMGPRTGLLGLDMDGSTLRQMSYDKFCYYDRVGAFLFGGQNAGGARTCRVLRIEQLPDLPETELLKGTKNTDSRVGALGHVFIER
ncbi:SGNH/GDSL hydrolase family protein [Puniceibacterium confluentis]|uniref:SGNH/GDSL hydrolase family protein n=1 Tax=Puniceibacterium confluentis TaxID=1958944 RepID=UPI0011B7E224|nr:hypothetical protein [Puniceibacterium confluentis]